MKKFGYAIRGFFIAMREEKSLVVQVIVAIIMILIATILYRQMRLLD
jgi:diacylglycerol kinase